MLELKGIYKDYLAGSGTVHALQGIDLQFRKSEFVSILGPSGCGKTTLLNIIGGLDQYTKGDLVINGRSTKHFKDRDWDSYRNHSVGFVFQSYNLIPHQTVLQNVEIALTLSGVSRKIRRQKAIKALEAVGLGDQLRKRPSQMSGGQMQRVAIARALVNDPDIILADEPTGALDSETSVQVMEILKEVAKDRLVVMVTHNPDLAENYSTRIIRMLDGRMQSDSMPLTAAEVEENRAEDSKKAATATKEKKPAMKWGTAFGLSLKNLVAKRGRTTLTSFAGSIGIIGIALIYAVSQGMTTYINAVQEDTLSSYPLTLEASTVDLSSLMATFIESAESREPHEKDAIYSKGMLYDLVNALSEMETTENDLKSFKAYLEKRLEAEEDQALRDAVNGIQYGYNLNMTVYTQSVDGTIIETNAEKLLQGLMSEYMGTDISGMMQSAQNSNLSSFMMTPSFTVWQEMLPGKDGKPINDLLQDQYDVIYGSWPNSYDEIVLVVDENNELSDLALYALGLTSEDEMRALMEAADKGTSVDTKAEKWTYEEICAKEYHVVLPSDGYIKDEKTGLFIDLRGTEAGMQILYDGGLKLKITGIIRPNEDAVSSMLTGSIGYTSALTAYVIEQASQSEVVQAQLAEPSRDVLTGLPFRPEEGDMTQAEKATEFKKYVSQMTLEEKAKAFATIQCIPPEEVLQNGIAQAMEGKTLEEMKATLIQAFAEQTGMDPEKMAEYMENMSEEDVTEYYKAAVAQQVSMQYAQNVQAKLPRDPAHLAASLDAAMESYTEEQSAAYYDAVLTFSENTYEDNLILLGDLDLADPAVINIYASSFENKELIEDVIADYNAGVEEVKQITYTDYMGLMMSSITTIINAITYVLISFVAISLVVSSIMIGVITLISVQERTKEIGILRAIGASKSNVSSMFNAETVMIGAASGAIGVGLTYLLCIPINAVIHYLTGIPNLNAYLPVQVALVLIGVSIFLSVFAGFIPSRSAAKKDPVVALRTE